jgi:hypothetical protein
MNNKLQLFILLFSLIMLPLFSGCLTTEYKEYRFTINDDGSGEGTIKYVNIMSQIASEQDSPEFDFNDLIESYIQGSTVEQEYPKATIVSKNLVAEDGVLNGYVKISFKSLDAVNLYKYDENSPLMFYTTEEYVESDGDYNADAMPIVFWKGDTKEVYIKTLIASTEEGTEEEFVSLKPYYEEYQQTGKLFEVPEPVYDEDGAPSDTMMFELNSGPDEE